MRFEVSTLLILKILVFWDINPTTQHILEDHPKSDMVFAGRANKWVAQI